MIDESPNWLSGYTGLRLRTDSGTSTAAAASDASVSAAWTSSASGVGEGAGRLNLDQYALYVSGLAALTKLRPSLPFMGVLAGVDTGVEGLSTVVGTGDTADCCIRFWMRSPRHLGLAANKGFATSCCKAS